VCSKVQRDWRVNFVGRRPPTIWRINSGATKLPPIPASIAASSGAASATPVLCSPPPIPFAHQPLELDFHPTEYMVATCLIDGHVHVYSIAPSRHATPRPPPPGATPIRAVATVSLPGVVSNRHQLADSANTEQFKIRAHQESCRSVHFHPSGGYLVTGSLDKSIKVRLHIQLATGPCVLLNPSAAVGNCRCGVLRRTDRFGPMAGSGFRKRRSRSLDCQCAPRRR